MSVSTYPTDRALLESQSRDRVEPHSVSQVLQWVLSDLASLQLTVLLFVLGMFVIWVGTIAQSDMGIWEVVDKYFRSFFMWVEFKYVFPAQFFGETLNSLPGRFPAPGGMSVGLMMALNLVAAHLWRFKVQARGERLWLGLGVLLLGIGLTWMVIRSGNSSEGLQGVPFFSWGQMWVGLMVIYFAGLVAAGWSIVRWGQRLLFAAKTVWHQNVVFWLAVAQTSILAVVFLYLLSSGTRIPDEGLRILWQLLQGWIAGLVLLAGCVMVFKQRGGVVLIHGGIGLMMFGEMFVSLYAVENQVRIIEGQSVNYVYDIRNTELAVSLKKGMAEEEIVAIPRQLLESSKKNKTLITDERLPFDIQVVDYLVNSEVSRADAGADLIATAGAAKEARAVAVAKPAATGTDTGGEVDIGAVYVTLLEKGGKKELGTFLLSQLVSEWIGQPHQDIVATGGKEYGLALRFQRSPRPYTIRLLDVRQDTYLGTSTARNYSSDVHVTDAERNVNRAIHIWMNNPLRYAGETFYQSNYGKLGRSEYTILSVVTNSGWMIPYVACMLVATGLLAHFLITLTRFLQRVLETEASGGVVQAELAGKPLPAGSGRGKRLEAVPVAQLARPQNQQGFSVAIAVAIAAIFFLWTYYWARPAKFKDTSVDLAALAKMPIVEDGRVKPFDTLARNSARVISGSYFERVKNGEDKWTPPTRWLMDTITASPSAKDYKLFRIDNPDLLELLNLEKRPGNSRYSVDEIGDRPLLLMVGLETPTDKDEMASMMEGKYGKFIEQVQAATALEKEKKELSPFQAEVLKLYGRLQQYARLVRSFEAIPLPPRPTPAEEAADPQARDRWAMQAARLFKQIDALKDEMRPVLAVATSPSKDKPDSERWQPYAIAFRDAQMQVMMDQEADLPTLYFTRILEAYKADNPEKFSEALRKYQIELAKNPPDGFSSGKVGFETWFNSFSPFFMGLFLYALAFLVVCSGIPFAILIPQSRKHFVWAAFCLVLLTFALHTVALVLRMYLSGRPPVTNLYSSAIFIGWAGVLLGLIIELVFRIGIGNLLASVAGFSTLLIAYLLAAEGDTLTVLVAVLDTQFWLATHVTCITLGYATTFIAGLAGVTFVFAGLMTPFADEKLRKILGLIIYGTVCFAIFFSFVGTVLGGLWADDSWGRFWGWDPKENGALLIVLWNAIVLHARWGGMVKDRGMAVLAIGGNIVTCWSWFGVNQLGIGLHSYGFNKGLTLALCWIVTSHLVVIALGLLPTKWWWSYAEKREFEAAS